MDERPSPATVAQGHRELCVMVHGLMEMIGRRTAGPDLAWASRVLGVLPVYVRYNSG